MVNRTMPVRFGKFDIAPAGVNVKIASRCVCANVEADNVSEPIIVPEEMETFELNGETVQVDIYELSNRIRQVYDDARENLGEDFNDFAYLAAVGEMLGEAGFPIFMRPGQVKFVADKVFELVAKKNKESAINLQALLS